MLDSHMCGLLIICDVIAVWFILAVVIDSGDIYMFNGIILQ